LRQRAPWSHRIGERQQTGDCKQGAAGAVDEFMPGHRNLLNFPAYSGELTAE
jgi:hypothetical protein